MNPPLFLVDAFGKGPFTGNPAAVCVLEAEADAAWMQRVAMEMNQAETAFLVPAAVGEYGLRWFTPTVEVDLCGHATLAAAHILWSEGYAEVTTPLTFHTRSGALYAQKAGDRIILDFPTETPWAAEPPLDLTELFPTAPIFWGQNRMDWFAELPDEADVRGYRPDFAKIDALGLRGLIVTAAGSGDFDFVSRFFAPQCGILEDPVTGSAHCALAPYWSRRLGRSALSAYQASPRGGWIGVEHRADRVKLSGQATTTLRGTLTVTPAF